MNTARFAVRATVPNLWLLIRRLLPSEAAQGDLRIFSLQFDPGKISISILANRAHGSGTEEGVENEAARSGTGKHHGFDQRRREGGEVGFGEWVGVNAPDGAPVSLRAGRNQRVFAQGFAVVEVVLIFGQQEDVFVGTGGPVPDGLGLAVGLVPDDVRAEKPTVGLESEGQLPGDTDQVFGLQARGSGRPVAHAAGGVFFIGVAPGAVAAGVGVADIQPESTVVPEHPAHLTEYRGYVLYILIEFHFGADLALDSVIAEPPIRRACYAGLKDRGGKLLEHRARIADDDPRAVTEMAERKVQFRKSGGRLPVGPKSFCGRHVAFYIGAAGWRFQEREKRLKLPDHAEAERNSVAAFKLLKLRPERG